MHAAVRAVRPDALVARALAAGTPWAAGTPVWIVAAGKAASGMAGAAAATLGPMLRGGVAIGPAVAPVAAHLEWVHGEHPAPGSGSEDGGRRALAIAGSVPRDARLLVLLSGGASSLMAVPAPGLTIGDKRRAADVLMRAGADIHALNTVRKHLSLIKGGRLACAGPAASTTWAISDVVGDDLSVIGSGPTVADPSTFSDALGVLRRFGSLADFPPAVVHHLTAGARGDRAETPKPGHARLAESSAAVIGGRFDAMRGAEEEACTRGYDVIVHNGAIQGEARVAGYQHVQRVLGSAAGGARRSRPLCVISSGETTVTVRGSGLGGRNQEFALAAVEALAGCPTPVTMASLGTDGIDGPTDAAGAIVDRGTLDRSRLAGLGAPGSFLDRNDAHAFFAASGDLIRTGPTGTNVGDLQVILLA